MQACPRPGSAEPSVYRARICIGSFRWRRLCSVANTRRRLTRLPRIQRTDISEQIEVVECRAQVENQASSKSLGSFGIAKLIVREEGVKGNDTRLSPRSLC